MWAEDDSDAIEQRPLGDRAQLILRLRDERMSPSEIAAALGIHANGVRSVIANGGRWKPKRPRAHTDEPRTPRQRQHVDVPTGWGFA